MLQRTAARFRTKYDVAFLDGRFHVKPAGEPALASPAGDSAAAALVRFPKHTSPYIFALYLATIMAFLMSLAITFAEFGVGPHYMTNMMNAYRVAMSAAFVCILVVRPVVVRRNARCRNR